MSTLDCLTGCASVLGYFSKFVRPLTKPVFRQKIIGSVNFHRNGCSILLAKLVVAEMYAAALGAGQTLEQVLQV